MFRTMLIRRFNTNDMHEEREIFFLIGNMNDVRENLLDYFSDANSEYHNNVTYKYNGISVKLEVQNVPKVIRTLVELDADIFGVYELYDPYEVY